MYYFKLGLMKIIFPLAVVKSAQGVAKGADFPGVSKTPTQKEATFE